MTRRRPPKPTDAELAILSVLWERGPSTVREIWEELKGHRSTGYTTVLKFLQIMMEKRLVTRDETKFAHIYEARLSREKTQRQLLRDMVDKAFGGSNAELMAQALMAGKTSPDELKEIRKLLSKLERGSK